MNKKIICVLLTLILALSTSACCCIPSSGGDYTPDTTRYDFENETESWDTTEAVSNATYIPGKISGNTYRSSWLGIQFALPHNMEFEDQVTHDRYNLMQIEQNPNDYTVQDLTVYYTYDSSPSITIFLTKLSPGQQSLNSLASSWKQNLKKTYAKTAREYGITIENYWYSDQDVRLADDQYLLLSHYTQIDGSYTYYYDYFKVHKGFLVHISFIMPGRTSTMVRSEFEPLFSKYAE